MRNATHTVAMWLGFAAGLGGLEHGIFEILQGNTRTEGVMIASMGFPCDPETAWNLCEPAMTILPSFFTTGLIAILISIIMIAWCVAFLKGKRGGLTLVLLALALLLFGGGFFPPLIGIIGGVTASQLHKPLTASPGGLTRLAARLWPAPLVLFLLWLPAQFVIGDAMKSLGWLGLLPIFLLLPLAVYVGYARDVVSQRKKEASS